MRILNFAKRNFKEIVRDPLSIIFSILLPLFLLFIFQQFKIPNEAYNIENFTPGIIIFSFSFITLFTATLVANDRGTSLLTRLCASPMKSSEYILGYIISVIPIIVFQNVLFFIVAILLGLNLSFSILAVIAIAIIISILFICLGIIIGSLTSPKSSSGIASVIVQLVVFTSGMYFSLDILGNIFSIVCKILPFSNCLLIIKTVLNSSGENIFIPIIITLLYIIIGIAFSIIIFRKKMISDNK